MISGGLLSVVCFSVMLYSITGRAAESLPDSAAPSPLAQGATGAVVGTTGPLAVGHGLQILKRGGSAADAAVATALAQVVECGGAYVSHAGIMSMVYYEAATGKVHYLNAGFNTVLGETEPLSIPKSPTPSGRTALVPGFMAGIEAAHGRFGKLPRQDVFAPAIAMAEQGIPVSADLAHCIGARKAQLSRLPDTKRIFSKEAGALLAEGDRFCQPELGATLRQVAEQGAAYMHSGAWADRFVAAVQKEGGRITVDDLRSYRVTWELPLETTIRGHSVFVPGLSSRGGVAMVEALDLVELAALPQRGDYATTPASLFWLMQISHCQVLNFLPEQTLMNFAGLDLTPSSRITKASAQAIWDRMQSGIWPFASKMLDGTGSLPRHSDGIVVVDQWGNVAAMTHTINTTLWGDTALFVDGVSIPDAAAFQQAAIQWTGPGKRLPEGMCPLIVLKEGKPVLGSSAIGGGLHAKTLQMLTSVLEFGVDPQVAVERPAFMLPAYSARKPVAQAERGEFDGKFLDTVRAMGQEVNELSFHDAGAFRGYWVGVQIVGDTNLRRAIGTRKAPVPAVAQAY